MAKNQQQPAVRAGQVWEPKRGVRSLREVNGDTASVRKFDERSERISEGLVGNFTWSVFRTVDDFFFRVVLDGAEMFMSAAEYSTAPKAERVAQDWCTSRSEAAAAQPAPTPESEPTPAPEAAPAPADDWLLVLRDDRGGTYQVDVLDPDTREPAPDAEVRGYETGAEAMEAARRWAAEHPRGKAPSGEAEGEAPESEPGLAPELPALDSDAIVEPEPEPAAAAATLKSSADL